MYFDTTERPTGHALHALAATLADRARRIQRRRQVEKLDLDDHILTDIGIARGDIVSVTQLPLSVDIATELHRMSLERSRRGR